MTFARTDGSAQIIVRLASPDDLGRAVPAAGHVRPAVLQRGRYAILTSYRWFNGQSEFASLTAVPAVRRQPRGRATCWGTATCSARAPDGSRR